MRYKIISNSIYYQIQLKRKKNNKLFYNHKTKNHIKSFNEANLKITDTIILSISKSKWVNNLSIKNLVEFMSLNIMIRHQNYKMIMIIDFNDYYNKYKKDKIWLKVKQTVI